MEEEPFILFDRGYQVLSYEGTNGIRVAVWKHPTRVDGEVFVECEIEPSPQNAEIPDVQELENAVLQILRCVLAKTAAEERTAASKP